MNESRLVLDVRNTPLPEEISRPLSPGLLPQPRSSVHERDAWPRVGWLKRLDALVGGGLKQLGE